MKKVILMFCMLCAPVWGFRICGTDVVGREYSYNVIDQLTSYWAVGDGCDGQTENTDVTTMCKKVIVGGESICKIKEVWSESTDLEGVYCFCQRIKILSNGQLIDSVGQQVLLGYFDTEQDCSANCSMYCAENVSNNMGGMRNAIMLLPAM